MVPQVIIDTRKKLIETWGENVVHIEESIWTSAIQQKDLDRIRTFLTHNSFNYWDLSIISPSDNSTEIFKWKNYYTQEGQCISTNFPITVPAHSNHLKLTVGLESDLKNQECQDKTLEIISMLRLIFGVTIARTLLMVSHYKNIQEINAGYSSELGFASLFDIQTINLHEHIEFSKTRKIPYEASFLLDTAFQQRFPNERFILMWIAFEAIIHSLPTSTNKSNGKKREYYFKEIIGSIIINDEIRRLHNIRSNIFKEGKFPNDDFEKENWSLYAAIQLAILDDCPQREAFTKGYENIILKSAQ